MLPRASGDRNQRRKPAVAMDGPADSARLAVRCAALDMMKLGENALYVDCDVIQADGGTVPRQLPVPWWP
jgi:ribonuclease PH